MKPLPNEGGFYIETYRCREKLLPSFQAVLQSVLQKGCPVGYRIKTIKFFSTANNKYFLRRF